MFRLKDFRLRDGLLGTVQCLPAVALQVLSAEEIRPCGCLGLPFGFQLSELIGGHLKGTFVHKYADASAYTCICIYMYEYVSHMQRLLTPLRHAPGEPVTSPKR